MKNVPGDLIVENGEKDRPQAQGMRDEREDGVRPGTSGHQAPAVARDKPPESPVREAAVEPARRTAGKFNRDLLLEKIGGNRELCGHLLNIFFEDTITHLQAIRSAHQVDKAEDVRFNAHTLKGAAGTIGAVNIQELAFRIEMAGKAKDLSAVPALLEELEAEFAGMKEELQPNGNTPL
ncbi:MAG: Hpt domain-containing protein [Candidatus Krumholzibacteriota bacterium]|nr:Hpt domain-containing protein [Candidatus Krumholzibacteriota bacterium]